MRSGRIRCVVLTLLAALIAAFGDWSQAGAQLNPDRFVFSACPSLAERMQSAGGLGLLLNPVFETRSQVEAEASDRREMLDCMESVRTRTVLPDWFGTVRYHLALFLSFAEPVGAGPAAVELIDLRAIDDPAVRALREEVGLRVPDGVVFVRYFPDRAGMPEIIRRAFESRETQAVTMSSRYVAVLTGSASIVGVAARRSLAATFSHEMVHAFLNAGLDWQDPDERFPSWFHEGMAIHFSGSGRAHVSLDPSGGVIRFAQTSDYERYERVFRYLEEHLGEARLHQAIRRTVADADTSLLLSEAGVETYEEVLEDAELWWRWWPVPVVFVEGRNIWLSGSVVLLLLIGVVGMWRRWQPAVPGSALEVNLDRDLIAAVGCGDIEEVAYLLASGANPNARDAVRWPVLLWAVWLGQSEIAEMLIDRGARATADIRQAAIWRDDPDIERIVADATTRQREVW